MAWSFLKKAIISYRFDAIKTIQNAVSLFLIASAGRSGSRERK
jgi:hypothetical protein